MTDGDRPLHQLGGPCLVGHLLSDDPQIDRVLDPVRDLSDAERDALVAAADLIDRLTIKNPYFALERAHQRWADTFIRCRNAATAPTTLATERLLHHDLPSAVNGVLSEFRGFVDRVDRWIGDALGVAARDAVRQQASAEYDASFDYRVASNLRNTAQHRASVVAVSLSSSEIAPGVVVDDLRVTVAPGAVDHKWQARVRAEVEARDGEPIDVVDMLKGVMRSCERIVARLLLEAEPATAPVVRLVLDAVDEVRRVTGDPAAAASVLHDDVVERPDGSLHGKLHLAHMRGDRAANLADMTAAAHALLD